MTIIKKYSTTIDIIYFVLDYFTMDIIMIGEIQWGILLITLGVYLGDLIVSIIGDIRSMTKPCKIMVDFLTLHEKAR